VHVTENKLTDCKKSYKLLSCTRPCTRIAILNKYRLLHTYIIKTPLYFLYIYITLIFFIPQKAIFMEFNLHSSMTSSKQCHEM